MDELLGVDFRVATKDRLYRCLDRLLDHKEDLLIQVRTDIICIFTMPVISRVRVI